tara:strand:+ start:69 stop:572 length:504 start_codon:yes stop_codon:yes gene_type:complete
MKIIVAVDQKNGIGLNNGLPWKFATDMKHFRTLTTGQNKNCIIMGKNTHISIGKALPNRDNLILSTSLSNNQDGTMVFNTLKSLVNHVNYHINQYDDVWIIGGASIYSLFMQHNLVSEVYLTRIHADYDCDTFFPEIDLNIFCEDVSFSKTAQENNTKLSFHKFIRK